jgi:farnesyl diphosphate synthase
LKAQTETPFDAFVTDCQSRVEKALDACLPPEDAPPTLLHKAMRYSTLNGGKRIRPLLIYAAGTAIDIGLSRLDGPACAVELIHAYSLIHDDLPAMDDDCLRRGRPTCHRAFDEATAILAGDALQSLAFQVLTRHPSTTSDPAVRLHLVEALATASGSRGMAGGQALDLASEGRQLELLELENVHIHKTGALLRCCVQMATLLRPDLDPAVTRRLDRFAKCMGLAFQIRDDILDVEGDTRSLGKTGGKDAEQNKATYPSVVGLAESRAMAAQLYDQAMQELERFDGNADLLRGIARYIVGRQH